MITKNINSNFYPVYTDIEEANVTKAFSIPVKPKFTYTVEDFKTHFRTVDDLTEFLDDAKIDDFAVEYFKFFGKIESLYEYASVYLTTTDIIDTNKYAIGNEWESIIKMLYEKFRMSDNMFDTMLYSVLLHDFLWNALLDPYNPEIVKCILAVVEKHKASTQVSVIEEAADNKNNKRLRNVNVGKLDVDIDKDYTILIKKNYKADLQHYFANSLKVIKVYRDSNDVNNVKKELAKMFFINEIIEARYIYNKKLTAEDKEKYPAHIVLRSHILSAFKTYLQYVIAEEPSFDFADYYELSPYSRVATITQKKIKTIKALVKGLLLV